MFGQVHDRPSSYGVKNCASCEFVSDDRDPPVIFRRQLDCFNTEI